MLLHVQLSPSLSWSHISRIILSDGTLLSQIVQKVADLQDAISEGATSFLFTEYKYMGIFMVITLF